MNYYPVAMEGHIVPGVRDPHTVFSYVTSRPHGEPQKVTMPREAEPLKPKDMGAERHMQLLSAIKGLSVEQTTKQTAFTEALPSNRDWRG